MDISEVESPNLQRLIVLATKWIPKDHHDWEELQNMGWEICTVATRYNDSKPTEETKAHDLGVYGMTVEKDGKRIDPKDMYKPVIKEGWEKRFDKKFELDAKLCTELPYTRSEVKSFIRNETRGEGDG